jgi:hypothetical protein
MFGNEMLADRDITMFYTVALVAGISGALLGFHFCTLKLLSCGNADSL